MGTEMSSKYETRQGIKKLIEESVFQRTNLAETGIAWIFDFRRASLTPNFLDLYTKVFFENFEEDFRAGNKFQVCGLESASISLISAIVLESQKRGLNINGFFIRKSKKKHDMMNDIEGVPNEYPVIIVDDILNSGKTTLKQLQILKAANGGKGIPVKSVFSILRFRDLGFYNFITDLNINIVTLFELNDFKESLGLKNKEPETVAKPINFETVWSKKYAKGNFKSVIRKSAPVLDNSKIYFGTDEGFFLCVDASSGNIIWQYKILFGADGKYIISSPKIYNDYVFFGAYDGNFYCLDKNTGKKVWVYMDADWVGSSPCISGKLGLVYIGLEYGLFAKKGGIVAIDIKTGKEVWKDFHESLTHCSPFVSDHNNLLFCGSNDGVLRIYNSKTGQKLKEHNIGGDIKDSFVENEPKTKVAFGSFAKKITIINTKSLEIDSELEVYEAIYSTPVWVGDDVIFTCLDKRVYRYDTKNKVKKWELFTNSRIFSDPLIIGKFAFVGNNSGILSKVDIETGKEAGYLQFAERIVNKCIYDEKSKLLYVPTLAHEVYCIRGEFIN